MKIVRRNLLLPAAIGGAAAFFLAVGIHWARRVSFTQTPDRVAATVAVSVSNAAPARASVPHRAQPRLPLADEARQRIDADPELRQLELDLRAAAHLSDPDERQAALVAACSRWAKRDPRDAIAIARELQIDQRPGEVMDAIVQAWASSDAPAAAAWADSQPASEERDRLAARAAFVWSQKDPLAAATFVVDRLAPGPAQDEAVMSVLHQWGLRDLAAATTWVNSFPAGALRDRALSELANLATQRVAPPGG